MILNVCDRKLRYSTLKNKGGEKQMTIDEIKKLNSRENIVKIKDKTKVGIDIERIAEENNVRGIFVRNMLERKERENLDEDFIEKAIEIGLEVL